MSKIPRHNLHVDAQRVECSACEARRNRRCVRVTNPNKGQPVRDLHRQRIASYLLLEATHNPPISNLTQDELVKGIVVRCRSTGMFGKIDHAHTENDDTIVCIGWNNGKSTKVSHKKANTIMKWQWGLLS